MNNTLFNMRKYIFLLLAVAAITAISCGKETDEELFAGRWKLIHEKSYKTDGSLKEENDYPFNGDTKVWVFDKDKTFRLTEVKSSKVTVREGAYVLLENDLLLNDTAAKVMMTAKIMQLEKKKLSLEVFNKYEIKTFDMQFEKMK